MSTKFCLIQLSTFLLTILILGCPFVSNVPLDSSEKAKLDKKLIGKWVESTKEDELSSTLSVFQFNKREHLIIIEENNETAIYGAFVTKIKGNYFLNARSIEKEPRDKLEYAFVKYSIKDDSLFLQIVDDKLFKENFTSSKKLRKFISENLDNDELYGELEILIRVKE